MKDAMRVKTLTINLTKAEENFHEKILRLSGNEFSHLHQTLSQDEFEKFAISFLKEESENLLFENGYDVNRIKKEFGNDEIKLIHQALKFYGNTINKNQ